MNESFDIECATLLNRYIKGEISKEEAERHMQKHGDKLRFDLLSGGFTTHYSL